MRPQSLFAGLLALLVSSCFSPGEGQAPPLASLYFPTGLALDRVALTDDGAPKYLYVASSDFDLQYRSSSLLSYDLLKLRQAVPRSCSEQSTTCGADERCDTEPSAENAGVPSFLCVKLQGPAAGRPCREFGNRSAAQQLLYPGRCNSVDPITPQDGSQTLIADKVGIGAFASDVIVRVNPSDAQQSRLFLPVRGDATLHWIDLNDGHFECGQAHTSDGESCDGHHRAGDSTAENSNQLRQPAEPFAIDATADARYVAITNQTTGSVSLFAHQWGDEGPKLESILSGLPQAPVAIAALPSLTPESDDSAPGFLVAYRNAAQIDLLRVRSDQADMPGLTGAASYSRYALTRAGSAPINANSTGFDSRGIVVDSSEFDACRNSGALGDALRQCLHSAHLPEVYVANRTPASLLVGTLSADASYFAGTSALPSFTDSIALTAGPSRLWLGTVKVAGSAQSTRHDEAGPFELERRVFIVCFDSRRIFVYDPKRRVID